VLVLGSDIPSLSALPGHQFSQTAERRPVAVLGHVGQGAPGRGEVNKVLICRAFDLSATLDGQPGQIAPPPLQTYIKDHPSTDLQNEKPR